MENQVIGTPLQVPELELQPPYAGNIVLSSEMQQSLALLTAFYKNTRVILKGTPNGILNVTSCLIQDVEILTSTAPNEDKQGSDIKCSECIVISHPDNVGRIYFKPNATATTANGLPLDSGDSLNVGTYNLNSLNFLIVSTGDKVILLYG
jgi:hypothetical protein